MPFEYSVVPAPKKGQKAKGVRSAEDRFAYALQQVMNEKGADGWEYVRTDTLPSEERQGLTGSKTVYQNMMVFRRVIAEDVAAEPVEPPVLLGAPEPEDAPEPDEDEVLEAPTFISRDETRMMRMDETEGAGDDPLRADVRYKTD